MRAECGVDYLTCTIPPESTQYAEVNRIGRKLLEGEHNEGNQVKPFKIQGYEGVICGSVFVGECYQGAMVRASGFSAKEAFNLLKGKEVSPTRIDLQVTVWIPENHDKLMRTWVSRAIADNQVADGRTRRKLTTWEDNRGGYTLYIGARTSDYFGRMYDKQAESKDDAYTGAVRFEVEIKGKRAKQVFEVLAGRYRDRDKAIVSFVGEWYASRGVYVPFLFEIGQMELSPIKRDKSDTARRLEWLRSQVRHTVIELRKVVDTNVILDVLGFFEELSEE